MASILSRPQCGNATFCISKKSYYLNKRVQYQRTEISPISWLLDIIICMLYVRYCTDKLSRWGFFCVPRCSWCVSFVKITGFASRCELQEFAHIFVCKLQWRQIERDGVSNHQPHRCLRDRLFSRRSKKTSKPCITGLCEGNSPDRLFRRRSKKTSKPRIIGLCEGNSPVTGEFPAQRASNAEIFPCDDVIKTRVYLIVHSRPHSR